jgi:hypothetical protein
MSQYIGGGRKVVSRKKRKEIIKSIFTTYWFGGEIPRNAVMRYLKMREGSALRTSTPSVLI